MRMAQHKKGNGPGSWWSRPPNLPSVPSITSRLLLQIGLLTCIREEFRLTWEQVLDLASPMLGMDLMDIPRVGD